MMGRLNSFQKTMLQWNDLHPYNAIHVADVSGALDPERLNKSICSLLESQGLTRLELNRQRGQYCFHGGRADPDIRILKNGGSAEAILASEIERQLNLPFAPVGPFEPF